MDNFLNNVLNWRRFTVSFTLSGPAVKATLPPSSYFKFPPSPIPTTLPTPPRDPSFAHPFTIPTDWYNALLSPTVPITFAIVYASVITYMNSVNVRRNKKPWAISQTSIFKVFVILHNIFLSLYSLWTFIGMVNCLRNSIVNPREHGLAATVDSFCKLNGPRGFGSAATYNETTSIWGMTDRAYHLAKDGTPDSTDVGRIWNEGLAFYGWLFYISKFYEVVDTLIIIAKGKKSSFLQTYHHAGAMLCMWAGMRYMSPPIWSFCFLNSFIHFIMYSFYTATTVGIKVPRPLKRTLTTMQIAQFVLGMGFAFSHFFVAYQMPISIPYVHHLGEAIQRATPSIKSDAASALSVATATASGDVGAWLKKLALRAAGREGLAENVENELGRAFGIDAVHAAQDFVQREEIRYRDELRWTRCVDTSGQAFAIYLNLFYLLPLTWLFLQFFINAYLQRVEARRRSSVGQRARFAGQSLIDAQEKVSRRLSKAFEDYQGANGDVNNDNDNDEMVVVDGDQIRKELRELAKIAQDKGHDASNAVSEKVADVDLPQIVQEVKEDVYDLREQAMASLESAKEATQNVFSSQGTTTDTTDGSNHTTSAQHDTPETSTVQEVKETISETTQSVQNQASNLAASVKESVEDSISPETKESAAEAVETVQTKTSEAVETVKESVSNSVSQETKDSISESLENATQKAEETVSTIEQKVEDVAGSAGEATAAVEHEVSNKTEEGQDAIAAKLGDVEDKAETMVEKLETEAEKASEEVKAETSQLTEKGSDAVEKVEEAADENIKDSAAVQNDKTFAEAAAEGVPEEAKGEHQVVEETAEGDEVVKKEADEGA